MGIQQSSHIHQEALKKRLHSVNVGPGSYDVSKLTKDIENENSLVSVTKKPAPAFNSGAPRIDQDRLDTHRRAQTITQEDPVQKPIYDL